jgi:Uncharacterized protein conserved in bacteria
MTRTQLCRAAQSGVIELYGFDSGIFTSPDAYEKQKGGILDHLTALARKGKPLFIALSDFHPETCPMTKAMLNERILYVLSDTLKSLTEKITLRALVLIGGETSYRALKALDVGKISIDGNLGPGIAKGYAVDSGLKGIPMILKGGSIGQERTMMDIINHIEGRCLNG